MSRPSKFHHNAMGKKGLRGDLGTRRDNRLNVHAATIQLAYSLQQRLCVIFSTSKRGPVLSGSKRLLLLINLSQRAKPMLHEDELRGELRRSDIQQEVSSPPSGTKPAFPDSCQYLDPKSLAWSSILA